MKMYDELLTATEEMQEADIKNELAICLKKQKNMFLN